MTGNPIRFPVTGIPARAPDDKSLPDRALVCSWVLVRDFGPYIQAVHERFCEIPKEADAGIGYVYIDHDAGISMKVECLCTVRSPAGPIAPGQLLDAVVSLKFRYPALKRLNFSQLSAGQVQDMGLPPVPDWLEFYETPDLVSIRGLAWLDPFRAHGFFDDVMAVLPGTGGDVPELVWVRLSRYVKDTDRFLGSLLNEPFRDYGIHRGNTVEVRVARNPDGITLVVVPCRVSGESGSDSNYPENPPGPGGAP